jgi:hypothetical protein
MQQSMHIRIEKKGKKVFSIISERIIPEYFLKFWIRCLNFFRLSNLLFPIKIIILIIDKIYIILKCKGTGVDYMLQYHVCGILQIAGQLSIGIIFY